MEIKEYKKLKSNIYEIKFKSGEAVIDNLDKNKAAEYILNNTKRLIPLCFNYCDITPSTTVKVILAVAPL